MLALHHEGTPLQLLTPVDFINESDVTLLTICVITGWKLPNMPMLSVLQEQFRIKLQEDYLSLTSAEIKYAFRNASHIKNWGAELNLNLVDQVLAPYLHKRSELRMMAEKMAENKQLALPMPKMTPQQVVEFWQKEYQNGEVDFKYLPTSCYKAAKALGLIQSTEAEKLHYLQKAQQHWLNHYQGNVNVKKVLQLKGDIAQWREMPEVQMIAKALCMVDYFSKLPKP